MTAMRWSFILFATMSIASPVFAIVPAAAQPASAESSDRQPSDDQPPDYGAGAGRGTNEGQAPFMAPLGELSSVLGSLSFLRGLCGDSDAGDFRQKMQALIDAQKPTDADRRRLIARFNSGYRGFAASYRTCTPAARRAVQRYRDQGLALSREIVTRYGS